MMNNPPEDGGISMDIDSQARTTTGRTNVSGWTRSVESMLRAWRVQLMARALAHEEACSYFKRYDRMINIPNIFLSAILGSIGMRSITDGTHTPETEGRVSSHELYVSLMSMLIALLTAMDAAMRFGVKSASHALVSGTYSKLATSIEVQLVKTRSSRDDASYFVDKIINAMQQLRESCPAIPLRILKKHPHLLHSERPLHGSTGGEGTSLRSDAQPAGGETGAPRASPSYMITPSWLHASFARPSDIEMDDAAPGRGAPTTVEREENTAPPASMVNFMCQHLPRRSLVASKKGDNTPYIV